MKKIFLALFLAAVCSGCATRYNITTTSGDIITAKGKPHLNADKSAWLFTDVSGRSGIIPAGNVTQVAPQSMDKDNPSKFIPAPSK